MDVAAPARPPLRARVEDFFQEVVRGKEAALPAGWSFPALLKTPGGKWLLISEAALDGSYPGVHLAADAPNGVYRIAFPDPEEGLGVGEIHPQSPLPWVTPWRVVAVADDAIRLVESDIINDLSPPTRLKDTSWITPGRSSWSWWSKSDSPKHAADLKSFVDLAAEMRWEYSLIDANWNQMQTGNIADVLAHARGRKLRRCSGTTPAVRTTTSPRRRATGCTSVKHAARSLRSCGSGA